MPDVPRDEIAARAALSHADPDAHGQAALLLAEATLHVLVETGVLPLGTAIGAVRSAAEVKVEVAAAAGESSARMEQSLALLKAIKRSLAIDAGAEDGST